MKLFRPLFIVVGLLLAGVASLQAQTTINFTSPIGEIGKTSTGSDLDASFTFAIGSFGNFTPDSSNVADWASNFTVLGSVNWTEGLFSQYSGTGNLLNNNAPFTTSNQGFIWGYNTQVIGASTEWILLTNASWTFPTSGSQPTVDWTSTDVGTYAALGVLNTLSSDPYLQTANLLSAVPEPSTYALLAGLATLGFVWFRRRAARA